MLSPRRAALLFSLTFASVAHADPITLLVIGFQVAAGTSLWMVALTVAMQVYGQYEQRKAKAKAKRDYNAGLEERTVTNVSTERPHMHVYGTARVGSAVVAIFTSGDKDQFKHLVCIHAAHECNAIPEIYINGHSLGTLDANGFVVLGSYFNKGVTQSITEYTTLPTYTPLVGTQISGTDENGNPYQTYQYATSNPTVRVKKHLGGPTDPADASLLAEVPSKWFASSVLRGFCYTVIRLDLNNSEFQGGLPQIEVLLQGKKVFDPRNSTVAWSANPALCMRDYLLGPFCGVPAADVPDAYYIAAANECDTIIALPIGSGIIEDGPKYTLNGTITSDQSQQDVLQSMAAAMAGTIIATTWECYAGAFTGPVLELDQSDIVGAVSITPGHSDADKFNGVKARFVSAENAYVPTDAKPYQNAAYLAADGKDLFVDISYPWTDSVQRVHNLARITTEDQRQGYTMHADFSLKTWGLRVGERVKFTSALFGHAEKVFRVIGKSFSPSKAVTLTLKEDAASIWDLADEVLLDATPNTNLPNPFDIAPLASLTAASGTAQLLRQSDGTVTSRIKVSWPLATTGTVQAQGAIEIEYRAIPSLVWEKTSVSGSETAAYLLPVTDGAIYVIRARCKDVYLNAASDWVYAPYHSVIGKTEPPPAVLGLQAAVTTNGVLISWSGIDAQVLDYATTALQRGTVWGAQPDLTRKTSTTHLAGWLPAGVSNFLAKHYDTSGNASVAAASTQVSIQPPATPVFSRTDVEENVLKLQWQDCKTTQPLKRLIYKVGTTSDTWATALDYGTDGGAQRVTLIVSNTPGLKRVFVAAEDVGDNIGIPAFVDVTFSLPSNYVLSSSFTSTFAGAGVSATNASLPATGGLLMLTPVETWAQHFSSNGWTTTADQVAAGKPLYFQPGTTTAQYVESYDMGNVLASSTITFNLQTQWLSGTGVLVSTISYRDNPANPWIDVVGTLGTVASNFRYFKITLDVSASGTDDLFSVVSLQCNLALRQITETLMFTTNAADAAGTVYTNTRGILDITAHNFVPMGTTAAYVDVIPVDNVQPAYVRVKAYDAALNRVTVTGNLTLSGTTA